MKEFNEIINEICNEENIELIPYQNNWLKELKKENKTRYIVGYKFSLNNQGIGQVVDDKGLFHDVINGRLPIIVHHVLFHNYDREEVLSLFHKYNNKIIIKGNIGTCGKEVYLIEDENRLFNIIDKLFESQYSISLCPFYDINKEYRLVVLNNEIKLIYSKENPVITGDGIKTIRELLMDFNPVFYSKNHIENEEYVPELNKKIVIEYRFNLSNGARVNKTIDDDLKNKLISLAKEVINLTNISFGSIDIIKTTNNELFIMEANSGVMMNNYLKQTNDRDTVKEIYKEAILAMFKE